MKEERKEGLNEIRKERKEGRKNGLYDERTI
jgi:hypothetical protein